MLTCSKCRKQKSVEFFSRNKAHKTGYANWCKACISELGLSAPYLEARRRRRSSNIQHALYIELKCRARRAGIDFELVEEDLTVPELCPVLGIVLRHELTGRTDATPTVDRIDPERGYVRDNVAVVSWLANRLKSNCTDPTVFERIAVYLRARARPRLKVIG